MTEQNETSSFSFLTPELTHRVELILHLLEYSNHLVIVKGEHESGKSTLCEELSRKDESNLLIRKLIVKTHTTTNDILKVIIDGDVSDASDSAAYDQASLNQWLDRCQNKQQVPVLLVDDVDLFNDDLVNSLFEILTQSNVSSVLHICLFCDPSFLERLDEPGISHDESRSLHIIEMPGLSEKQTEQYIHSKYPEGNVTNTNLFDEKTVKQIHRISHGMPGRINALCEQYLDDPAKSAEIEDTKPKRNWNVKEFLLKNKLIIMVVVLLFILSIAITSLLHKTPVENTETQTIKLSLPNKSQSKDADQTETTETILPTVSTVESEAEPVTIEELSPPVIPQLSNDLNDDTQVTVYNAVGEVIAKESDLEKIAEAGITELTPVDNESVNQVEVIKELVVEPEPIATIVAEPAPKPEPVQKEKPKEPEVKDIQWLLKQDPKKYVLQLIGAYEKETIDIYLKSFNKNDDKIISFDAKNKGKEWHVLVYGLYDNRDAAVAAIEALPTKAKLMAPWPRTIESIKGLLK